MGRDLEALVWVVALALVVAPLERLWPRHTPHSNRMRVRTDLLHVLVSGWVIRWGLVAVTLGLALIVRQALPSQLGDAVRSQPIAVQFLELLVLSDLGFYAAHRLVHSVPWLWRFHAIHHSSPHLDWLATYRVHPVDQVLNSAIIGLPLITLGFSPVAALVYASLYRIHALLLHSNVKLEFGVLERLIISPRLHHWHHANHAEAFDKNFGGQLSIFDRLFGTLHSPAGSPEAYGVAEPVPDGYLGQLVHPLRRPPAQSTEALCAD